MKTLKKISFRHYQIQYSVFFTIKLEVLFKTSNHQRMRIKFDGQRKLLEGWWVPLVWDEEPGLGGEDQDVLFPTGVDRGIPYSTA